MIEARLALASIEEAARELAALWATGTPTVVGDVLADATPGARRPVGVSLAHLDRIVRVDVANGAAVVEAGAPVEAVRQATANVGLWCPALRWLRGDALIGAVVAGGHGRRSRRYGAVGDYLLGMRFACPSAGLVAHGSLAIKNATGYNLTALVAGSRGELGVILEVTLRLVPLARFRTLQTWQYPAADALAEAARRAAAARAAPATSVSAPGDFVASSVEGFDDPGGHLLLVEVEGATPEGVAVRASALSQVAHARGASLVDLPSWPPTEASTLGPILRVGVPPATIDRTWSRARAVQESGAARWLLAEFSSGALELGISAEANLAPEVVRSHLGLPHPHPAVTRLRATLKSAFDPEGLLLASSPEFLL